MPVVLHWADQKINAPVGLGLMNTRLLFPLTDKIAINGGFELEDGILDIDADDVAKVNGNIVRLAHRQVYASDENFAYSLPHNGGMRYGRDLAFDQITKIVAEPGTDPRAQSGTTFRRARPKIGRNELCPCGSEAKYKFCHGN